jgi:Flp pilus assembly protein TadG
MPLATSLAEMLTSGKVTVSTNNVEALEIKAANKKIDINALNKEFLKQTLAAARDGKKSKGTLERIKATVDQTKTAQNNLSQLKEVAEELSEVGITVTLSYKGDVVVTMGSQAKPKLSSSATGTKAIEINSPRKLIELSI